MAEEMVWGSSVSQRKNFWFFVVQFLISLAIVILFTLLRSNPSPEIHKFSPYILVLLAVPMFIAGQRYLQTKCTRVTVSIDFRRASADRNPIKVFRG